LVCKNFASDIGVTIENIKFNSIEIETLQHIKTAFEGEEIVFQHITGNYIIDLYFPQYKIAIECDEDFHKSRKKKIR